MSTKASVLEKSKKKCTFHTAQKSMSEAALLAPVELTDADEAMVFCKEHKDCIRYSPSLGFLIYDTNVWKGDYEGAVKAFHALTAKQLFEVDMRIKALEKQREKSGHALRRAEGKMNGNAINRVAEKLEKQKKDLKTQHRYREHS